MTVSYPVGYRTLQYGHGASARPPKVFYRREMAYYEVLKIGSQWRVLFRSYSDSNVNDFYNLYSEGPFSRKLTMYSSTCVCSCVCVCVCVRVCVCLCVCGK